MEKEFVPYELARELKQLGFDEPCLAVFNDSKQFRINLESRNWNDNLVNGDTTSSPTFQQVFRWFREKHNIDAWVQPFVSDEEIYELAEKILAVDYLSFTEGAKWMRDKIKGGNNE
jgi:hypothetical protein